jgi:hypothetical protein
MSPASLIVSEANISGARRVLSGRLLTKQAAGSNSPPRCSAVLKMLKQFLPMLKKRNGRLK